MRERAVVPDSAPISRVIQNQTAVSYVLELLCHSSSAACQQPLLRVGVVTLFLFRSKFGIALSRATCRNGN
jgi:hypothetical protein